MVNVAPGNFAALIAEIVDLPEELAEQPCVWCNGEINVEERGTIEADIGLRIGHDDHIKPENTTVPVCRMCCDGMMVGPYRPTLSQILDKEHDWEQFDGLAPLRETQDLDGFELKDQLGENEYLYSHPKGYEIHVVRDDTARKPYRYTLERTPEHRDSDGEYKTIVDGSVTEEYQLHPVLELLVTSEHFIE